MQLEDDIKSLSQSIEALQKNLRDAKEKQKAAEQECKKLQRDMDEFKNNKDGKIDELKVLSCSITGSRVFLLMCCSRAVFRSRKRRYRNML